MHYNKGQDREKKKRRVQRLCLFAWILWMFSLGSSSLAGMISADIADDGIFGTKTGDGDEMKLVALTFDDGPHSIYTEKLLDGLRERDVKATFFLIGKNIEKNEAVVRQMAQDGHLIGSHTYSHVQLTKLNDEAACAEINLANEAVFHAAGQVVEYIRPPFGSWNDRLACAVNMKVVLWDVDPQDWKVKNKEKVVNHVMKHVKNRSIILLHDVYPTSVEAALEIVDRLHAEGYQFVTVDELILD